MNIVLCQLKMNTSIQSNLNKIFKIMNNNKFDICIFPELFLTSYSLKYIKSLSNKTIDKALIQIQQQLSGNQLIIVGTAYNQYNTAAIINKQKISFYYKNTLTEYDKTYFLEGKKPKVIELLEHKIGIMICRDQNNMELIRQYKEFNSDIIIQLSAHYYKPTKAIKKLDKNIAFPTIRAIDLNSLFFKVNTVGYFHKKVSLGSSMIVNKEGFVFRKGNKYKEEIIKFNTKDIKW